ncbi:MAG TPA: HEAT repeat domain-containing protein, partial [Bdellovibrionota bacterium]|nr:HEAT repeat domain-containing protein [Bdellovibrionota bacterium]
MMNNWKKYAGLAAAGLVVILAVVKLTHSTPKAPAPSAQMTGDEADARNRAIRERDLSLMADPGADRQELATALYRQGRQKLPEARATALKILAGTADPGLRAACAVALSKFDDEQALAALVKLTSDSEPAVRLQALESLGLIESASREEALRKILARGGIEEVERVIIYGALAHASVKEGERKAAVHTLIQAGAGGNGDAATRAVMLALSAAPKDPEVVKLLENKVKENKNDAIVPAAIRHLAAIGDPWITTQLKDLHTSQDPKIRLAVMQVLNRACPVDREQLLLSTLEHESSPMVFRAGLQEMARFPDELFEKTKARIDASKTIPSELRDMLVSDLPGMRATLSPGMQRLDPCHPELAVPP